MIRNLTAPKYNIINISQTGSDNYVEPLGVFENFATSHNDSKVDVSERTSRQFLKVSMFSVYFSSRPVKIALSFCQLSDGIEAEFTIPRAFALANHSNTPTYTTTNH